MMNNRYLSHTGTPQMFDNDPHGSGRYRQGSGENPHQHEYSFLTEVARMKKNGVSQANIAKALLGDKATTNDLRVEISLQKEKKDKDKLNMIHKFLETTNGNVSEVARRMGMNESSVRVMLAREEEGRINRYRNVADFLKNKADEKGVIDVSYGTEIDMNITATTKKAAIALLEKEGYVVGKCLIPQVVGNDRDKKTTVDVIAPPGTEFALGANGVKYINWRKTGINQIQEYTPDSSLAKEWWVPETPASLDSSRVLIRYGDEGGKDKDGVIELRRGVDDISLGSSQYAQVRIAVDNTHYLKGMAIYGTDIPKGYDIIYNTNKKTGTPPEKVFKAMKVAIKYDELGKQLGMTGAEVEKKIKDGYMTAETVDDLKKLGIKHAEKYIDKENPFGALIKAGGQYHYTDANGKDRLSPINKLREEGDWDSWSRNLASQFLSKQPLKLINQQLDLTTSYKKDELNQIMRLTNPVIKEKLLTQFANGCDADAADLSVKGFKNQAYQVLLPIPKMKDNEIYAPNYKDGDTVALIRYPHGGTFEIPILKVNNKNPEAEKIMKNARDAVGITPKTAGILSGADFDGDTALVIPMTSNRISIKSTSGVANKAIESLKQFEPKDYKLPDSAPPVKNDLKQREMGIVTNLINDMTVQGAPVEEIVRAVKHSMVVIDSEKHHLDMKQSYKDNNIAELKKNYQTKEKDGKETTGGASTILSRAKGETYVDHRREMTSTKDMTPEELKRWNNGERVWRTTGKTKDIYEKDKDGTLKYKGTANVTVKVHGMDTVDDAMDLVLDPYNQKEVAYAKYANTLKDLARQARKEVRSMKPIAVDQTAKKTYEAEVNSLMNKLRDAESNKPRERQAQAIANARLSEIFKDNPNMDYEHKNRERARQMDKARALIGAKKKLIEITDKEWEAIQANAISTNRLKKILDNTDQEAFKQRATPKTNGNSLTETQMTRIKAMYATGMYTQKDIAEALGVSASTVSQAVKN